MGKAIIAMVVLAVVAVFMFVGGGRVSVAKADNGATHLMGANGCIALDSNLGCVAGEYTSVSNYGGVEVDKAFADGVFNDTGKAVHWDYATAGDSCQSPSTGALTTDWSETLSASGHSELTCRFNG